MIYEIIYIMAMMVMLVIGIIFGFTIALLYNHKWYGFVAWIDGVSDRGLYWMMDVVLGKHEMIDKEDGNEIN